MSSTSIIQEGSQEQLAFLRAKLRNETRKLIDEQQEQEHYRHHHQQQNLDSHLQQQSLLNNSTPRFSQMAVHMQQQQQQQQLYQNGQEQSKKPVNQFPQPLMSSQRSSKRLTPSASPLRVAWNFPIDDSAASSASAQNTPLSKTTLPAAAAAATPLSHTTQQQSQKHIGQGSNTARSQEVKANKNDSHVNLQTTLMNMQLEYLAYEREKGKQQQIQQQQSQPSSRQSTVLRGNQTQHSHRHNSAHETTELENENSQSEFIQLLKTCQIVSTSEAAFAANKLPQSNSTKKLREVRVILSRSNDQEHNRSKKKNRSSSNNGLTNGNESNQNSATLNSKQSEHNTGNSSNFKRKLSFNPQDQFILRNALPTTAKNYLRFIQRSRVAAEQEYEKQQLETSKLYSNRSSQIAQLRSASTPRLQINPSHTVAGNASVKGNISQMSVSQQEIFPFTASQLKRNEYNTSRFRSTLASQFVRLDNCSDTQSVNSNSNMVVNQNGQQSARFNRSQTPSKFVGHFASMNTLTVAPSCDRSTASTENNQGHPIRSILRAGKTPQSNNYGSDLIRSRLASIPRQKPNVNNIQCTQQMATTPLQSNPQGTSSVNVGNLVANRRLQLGETKGCGWLEDGGANKSKVSKAALLLNSSIAVHPARIRMAIAASTAALVDEKYLHDEFSSGDESIKSVIEAQLDSCYDKSIRIQKKIKNTEGGLTAKIKNLLRIESLSKEIKQLTNMKIKK